MSDLHHDQQSAIERVRALGESLGFVSEDEQTVGAYIVNASYRPRLDVTWGMDLKALGFDLTDVAALTGNPRAGIYGAVGIEVEVSRPTTKRHFANLGNLALARMPFSLLVVDIRGEPDMYRRANRAVRAFNYRFGCRDAIAIDIVQLEAVVRRLTRTDLVCPPEKVVGTSRRGLGGESMETGLLRELLAERGREGGFVVLHDAADQRMTSEFDLVQRVAPAALQVQWDPGSTRTATVASQYWTSSRPDVVWGFRPTEAFRDLVKSIAAEVGGLTLYSRFGPVPDVIPVVSFELERSGGKHAAGAVFTLAAQHGVGIVVAKRAQEVTSMLGSHSRVIGTGQVVVMSEDEIRKKFRMV